MRVIVLFIIPALQRVYFSSPPSPFPISFSPSTCSLSLATGAFSFSISPFHRGLIFFSFRARAFAFLFRSFLHLFSFIFSSAPTPFSRAAYTYRVMFLFCLRAFLPVCSFFLSILRESVRVTFNINWLGACPLRRGVYLLFKWKSRARIIRISYTARVEKVIFIVIEVRWKIENSNLRSGNKGCMYLRN